MQIRPDVVVAAAAIVFVLCVVAFAAECPQGMTACKVLYLSPQEEAILTQERGILATAAEGRKLDLDAVSLYFRQKIKEAPAGEVKKPDEPKQ